MSLLLRITAPHFCAGVVISAGRVLLAAPILHYMVGWTEQRVRGYAGGKRWRVEVVEETK